MWDDKGIYLYHIDRIVIDRIVLVIEHDFLRVQRPAR